MMDPITRYIVDHLVDKTAEAIMPCMIAVFCLAVIIRMLIYYIARAESRFALEFEKRVQRYFGDHQEKRQDSFHRLVRGILESTFYEAFEKRDRYKRRNLDYITSVTDRAFLVQDGVLRLVQDTGKKTRYLKRDGFPPKMVDIARSIFDNNPVFNRLLGLVPVSLLNELLNILPSLFIIGGIFGTFLGIAKGLPGLGGMDLAHAEESKHIMDLFLVKISQSMVKSILGIALSVMMSLLNTVLSPEGLYYNLINRFSSSLDQLWNETSKNDYDENEKPFDPRVQTPSSRTQRSAA